MITKRLERRKSGVANFSLFNVYPPDLSSSLFRELGSSLLSQETDTSVGRSLLCVLVCDGTVGHHRSPNGRTDNVK
jgi:hypothetical protein